MQLHTPAQLEGLTGLTVGTQRTWRLAGYFRGRGQQTPGGQWRFTNLDVLFASITRVVAEKDVDLAVAAAVAAVCVDDIAAVLGAATPAPGGPAKPYLFIARFGDLTNEWFNAPADSDLKDGRIVHAESPYAAAVVKLSDLHQIPVISRAGGVVLAVEDLMSRLPAAVTGLFRGEA